MKQRKQFVGKPPVHGALTDIGSRISALERAGLQLPTKIIRVQSPSPKTPPTRPAPQPSVIPTVPPIPPPIVFARMELQILVGSSNQWESLYSLAPGEFVEFNFSLMAFSTINVTYRIERGPSIFDTADDSFTGLVSNIDDIYSQTLIGSGNDGKGYRTWFAYSSSNISVHAEFDNENNRYNVFRSRANLLADFAEAGIPVLSTDHGDFDLARTNTDDEIYNGRGIGQAHRSLALEDANATLGDFGVVVDNIYSLTEAYIFPFENPQFLNDPVYSA